jgi:uncharacterized protein YjbJ (UPF0337 family)
MNKHEVEGKAKIVKGRIKQAEGVLTANPRLEREGAAERTDGMLEADFGKARRRVGEALSEIGEAIKR